MSFDNHFITFDRCFHSHLAKHLQNGLGPVAFLIGQTADPTQTARALTECRQHRNDREEIRTIGCIHTECLERSTLHGDIPPVPVKL